MQFYHCMAQTTQKTCHVIATQRKDLEKSRHVIAMHCAGDIIAPVELHGHKENTIAVFLAVCVLWALACNGFTCHTANQSVSDFGSKRDEV